MNNTEIQFQNVVDACIQNGRRLLDDAEHLYEWERNSSSLALAILAQEEFAKAYIFKLIQEDAIPWCKEVRRATNNHSCKHLMGIVMEYLFTPIEDWMLREKEYKKRASEFRLPPKVADALNIFCHEKIHRWKSVNWGWGMEPIYGKEAIKISEGKFDKIKQNALYVSVTKDGDLNNLPDCDESEVTKNIEYAKLLQEVAEGVDIFAFSEKEYIKSALSQVFNNIYST
ncbi:AbiV family abortive infection protein [candidate division KSB1 bacterium]|nr:AbiV family abortive infection protein [candidate division KSB1 bacterium]